MNEKQAVVAGGAKATPEASGPLSHIRVLDFTALLQGPLATQILGDLGAEVIKFERPEGEWMRHWGILASRTHGEIDSFLAFNRNKRSVAADLKDEQTRTRILSLGRSADVVVENFRPGVMDRLGLGYEQFRDVNPAIVYASSSGYGASGPYTTRPGQDMLAQGLSGAMYLTGRADDPPTPCGIGIADEYTGMHLTVGILAALAHAKETGRGQRVEVDLLGCTIAAQQQELTVFLNRDEPRELARPRRNVGHVGGTAPFGVYQAANGYFTMAMFPCVELAKILDLPWLAELETNEQMYDRRDEVHERLSGVFAECDRQHWLDVLGAGGVWCAPVLTYVEMLEDPQVRHKDMFWDVPVGESGNLFRTVGSPFTFSETPARIYRGVPRVGQDTAHYWPEVATP